MRDEVAKNTAEPIGYRTAGEAQAKRNKTWDECGIEEKVERLRRELLQAREAGQYASRTASDAKELAARHQHSPTGEVLRPAERHGGLTGAMEGRFDSLR